MPTKPALVRDATMESTFEYILRGPRLLAGAHIVDAVGHEMQRLGVQRGLVLCGRRTGQSTLVCELRAALGRICVGLHDRISSHTPIETLEEALPIAHAAAPDCLITVGGGSVQDAGKLIALMLAEGTDLDAMRVRWTDRRQLEIPTLRQHKLPIIAVPSTLSAAEVVGAATYVRGMSRYVIVDPGIAPAVVLCDPRLAALTPLDVFLGTGVNAIAHCIEAAYSSKANVISDALAVRALQILMTSLERLRAEPDHIESRQQAQVGAYMSGLAYSNTWLGIAHSLCQTLGARYRVAQGFLHAVVLPHALRFNEPAVAVHYERMARAISDVDKGVADRGFVEIVDLFVNRLGLPRRLRDLNVPESELVDVANDSFNIWHTYFNPRRVIDPGALAIVLREAW